ncbi:efflux transporter periplasmic adaptor subunit [Rhodoplanes elegans]|uniref:Efflux transporter periplasmic adaptor subunit n=1 Tax=Rhodoplanes elegans TaxID=29408 RepID=A0A327KQX4_9BRAD|nr:efflux RND transporter periplasmic adaptor subunit [Rhodoplanes elegans]MBK5960146.1 efflux transporter periplasmic adaptor subunit [Rhodoplanes elegans]RAI41350.1 efflux transporter periplasmic adaptor subunit [Rhodoplanes elegans]
MPVSHRPPLTPAFGRPFRRPSGGTGGHPRGALRLAGVVLALVVLGLGADPARAAEALAVTAAQAERVGIETARIEERPATAGLRFPARVIVPPNRSRVLNAPLGGRIETMTATLDQAVRAGTVLAELQSPALAKAQADFLVANGKEQLLRETFEREQSLSPYGAVPRKQVVQTGSEYAQARATTAEHRQALRHYGMSEAAIDRLVAGQTLDPRLIVTAPVEGTVIETMAAPGQTVEALAPLYRLAQLDPLWIEIQVPAGRAEKIAVDAAVTIEGFDVAGRVVSIGTTVDPTSQTVAVRAECSRACSRLRPGLVVEAVIVPANGSAAEWRVRNGAVVRRGDDAFVFVQTDDGFVPMPVTVHEEMPDFAVVSGDFHGGERVVVRGIAALKGTWQGLGGVD